MKPRAFNWREDKLRTTVVVFWLICVFASFFGGSITFFYLPGIGAASLFRITLPITALLYLAWAIREKYNPWKHASYLLRICYVFCISLIVYGGLSLFRAMDFEFTFRRWANLCLELCFFFLALELGRDRNVFRYTIWSAFPAAVFQMLTGIVDTFSGGVFYLSCDVYPEYEGCDADHAMSFFGKECHWATGTVGNPNDYSMMLLFALALFLLYWVWRRHEEKCDWIPAALIVPVYFLICTGDARLCMVAFFVLLTGFALYALTLEKGKRWILIVTILLFGFMKFGCAYQNLVSTTDESALHAVESIFVSAEAASFEENQAIPLSEAPSLKDKFLAVDEETGELQVNQTGSEGIRLYLLLHAFDCIWQSKGLGVGLGNTEQLARVSETNLSGTWNIHCYLARMAADFGIFFLIPLLLIVFELLKMSIQGMIQGFKVKKASDAMMWVLYLSVLITYPIASTAPSDAQDALVMWLFLAGIVLFPMYMQKKSDHGVN